MTLKPANEIANRRYVESLADAEAHEALVSILAEDPDSSSTVWALIS
ncbi:MAG: hypothetical protein OXC28_07820 [Defluviicoccus sp.]|nr:hypothetical protein [Defluviicoccus sp.]